MYQKKPPLTAFALRILPPTWVGGKTATQADGDIVWKAVGPLEVPIFARRDGFIVFEFDKVDGFSGGATDEYKAVPGKAIPRQVIEGDEARMNLCYKRLEYMNAFLQALYSSYSTIQKHGKILQEPINPKNYFICALEDGKLRFGQGWPTDQKFPASPDTTEIATLENAIALMHAVSKAVDGSFIEILSLTYIASHQYTLHQFSSAQLIAWSVVEKLSNEMWVRLQADISIDNGGHTKMSKERREKLNGRDYTAAVINQILSISQRIDDALLERIEKSRKRRNGFAHNLEPISRDDASETIRLATDLMSNISGCPVTAPLGLGYFI